MHLIGHFRKGLLRKVILPSSILPFGPHIQYGIRELCSNIQLPYHRQSNCHKGFWAFHRFDSRNRGYNKPNKSSNYPERNNRRGHLDGHQKDLNIHPNMGQIVDQASYDTSLIPHKTRVSKDMVGRFRRRISRHNDSNRNHHSSSTCADNKPDSCRSHRSGIGLGRTLIHNRHYHRRSGTGRNRKWIPMRYLCSPYSRL